LLLANLGDLITSPEFSVIPRMATFAKPSHFIANIAGNQTDVGPWKKHVLNHAGVGNPDLTRPSRFAKPLADCRRLLKRLSKWCVASSRLIRALAIMLSIREQLDRAGTIMLLHAGTPRAHFGSSTSSKSKEPVP
jgi:hypothetical protein